MVKTLFIIFFAAIGGCREKVQDEYIRIDHIGINSGDHALVIDLIVSVEQKKTNRSFEKNIVVNIKLFDEIQSYAVKHSTQITKIEIREFAAFNISIFSDGKISSYTIPTKSKSIQYFTDLRKVVSESSDLSNELDKLLTLINE